MTNPSGAQYGVSRANQSPASGQPDAASAPPPSGNGHVPRHHLTFAGPVQEHDDEADAMPPPQFTADALVVSLLRKVGCEGPDWDEVASALAGYAYPILRAWVRSMFIIARLRAADVYGWNRLPVGDQPPSEEDAQELASETVAVALPVFRDKAILGGGWSATGSASLNTYFLRGCLYAFPKVYQGWWREREPLPLVAEETFPDHADPGLGADPAVQVVWRDEAEALLARIPELRTREMVLLRAEGYSHAEIAEVFGVTVKAVEMALYRNRRSARLRGGEGEA